MLGSSVFIALLLLTETAWVEIGGKAAPDFWTVMSAIGTVAATIVAVAVALQTAREKTREENIRARLAAAQLTPLLLHQLGKISAVCIRLDEFLAIDPTPDKYRTLMSIVTDIVENEPAFETVRAVASLPDDCAERIASGFAQLKLAYQMLKQAEFAFVHPAHHVFRQERSSSAAGLVKRVAETLQPAVKTCSAASKIKIGGPRVK